MKHTLAYMAALAMTGAAAQAAGPIYVNNYDSNNPIYWMDGASQVKATVAGTFVQLWASATQGGTYAQLGGDLGLVEDGFFDNGFIDTGLGDGADIFVKVKAWNGTEGTAGYKMGEVAFAQKTGTTPAPPAPPSPTALSFPGLELTTPGPVIPEPSTIALALLGGAALLLRRRN